MFIETARLEIREWTIDDFEEFAALVADPEVMRFSIKGGPWTYEEAERYFQKLVLDQYQNGLGLWALFYKEEQNHCIKFGIGAMAGQRIKPGYRTYSRLN